MKITKAKYNWLVAQYNYRKNKEQLIEISDEEYERLTGETFPHTSTGEQYSSQAPTIIGTWKGNMTQIENYRFGDNETSYIDSEITFLNNGKTYDEKTYNGIWTTYYNDKQFISYFNWNVNGIIYINFDDGSNGEITRYDLRENRFRGVFCNDNEDAGSFDLYKFI